MKVLYITHYSGLYGANKSMIEVIENMRKNYDIHPIVIVPSVGEVTYVLEEKKIEYYVEPYFLWVYSEESPYPKKVINFFRYKLLNLIAINRISKICKSQKIDLIHSNSSVIDIGAKIGSKLNLPHIWHIREFGKEDYNLKYYKGINESTRYMEENSDKVIFISHAVEKKYSQYFRDKNKLTVIYNGVSEENYYNDIKNKDYNGKIKIVFIGAIRKEKNQFELIKSINKLVNEKKYNDIVVYIFGDGDQEYINSMKEYINNHNLNEYIIFKGKVKNVKKYIRDSHIGVVCSKNEAFGRVTIEYMMGGITVIASNQGANTELINKGKDGMIYQLGDINDLSNKIEFLYQNREILQSMSILGQTKSLNEFTSFINTENIYKLYIETINKG